MAPENIKHIAILLPTLAGGGAERLAVYLAQDWLDRGYKVEFILLREEGELLALLPSAVRVTNLNVSRIRQAILPLARHLRKSRPDILWANMWPLTSAAVLAHLLAGKPGKLFVIDHIHLSASCPNELKVSVPWIWFTMHLTYRLAKGVMAVSAGVAGDLYRLSGLAANRIKVIYNPAARGIETSPPSPEVREAMWGKGLGPCILSVGTLKRQKNFELLIRAFARIAEPLNARLAIVGEGDLRRRLENLISTLGLQDRVYLPGFQLDPYPWFLSADLFVLSSDYEGLPTVLVEALECGVPVVSTDCRSGPAEILEGGRLGMLVPVNDEASLAAAIVESLARPHDRAILKARARDFSVDTISAQYLNYFASCQ